MNIYGEYFYGNKISDYGLENGFVDYSTLAKAFDAVLNNDIMGATMAAGFDWEMVSGWNDDDENETEPDVFQWYIVSDQGADILKEANEVLYYCEALDVYLWGVTHYGTAWSYVLTDIPCNTGKF